MQNQEIVWVRAKTCRSQSIKCSIADRFSSRVAVPACILYRSWIPQEIFLQSLQAVLEDFPLFAGSVKERENELWIDCTNRGVKVKIVHSQKPLPKDDATPVDVDFSPFIDFFKPSKRFSKPVLTVQLNYHPDGMMIGFCVDHTLGDGATFASFLKALSSCAKGQPYRKAVIPQDRGLYLRDFLDQEDVSSSQESSLRYLGFWDGMRVVRHLFSPKRNVHLAFTSQEMEDMRREISRKARIRLSCNEVLCAQVLHLFARAALKTGSEAQISLIVNVRSRLGISQDTLGNFVDYVTFKTDQPENVVHTATELHASLQKCDSFHQKATEEFVESQGGVKKIHRMFPKLFWPAPNHLVVTNWSGLDVESADFGIQKPVFCFPAGKAPFPYLGCITRRFGGGLSCFLSLPPKEARRLSGCLQTLRQTF